MELISFAISQGGTGTLRCPVLARLAKVAGCSVGTLYQIARGNKKPSAKLATKIEEVTGDSVSRRDLRPDDWHLIWPELVEAESAAEAEPKDDSSHDDRLL